MKELSTHWVIDDVQMAGFLAVIESIKKFRKKNGVEQGYNVKYLAGIVKNESKRFRLREDYERRTLDRIPPKLKENNEEY